MCIRDRVLLSFVVACDPGADPQGSDPDRSHTIALGSQTIDTRLAAPAAATSTSGDGYVLVKFPAPVTAAQLQALSASARIYTYLPHDTFLVRPNHGGAAEMAAPRMASALGVSWTGAYRPEYKIARGASDLAAAAPAGTVTVMATVFPDADLSRVCLLYTSPSPRDS